LPLPLDQGRKVQTQARFWTDWSRKKVGRNIRLSGIRPQRRTKWARRLRMKNAEGVFGWYSLEFTAIRVWQRKESQAIVTIRE
jgi:hypothetical protein